MKINQLLAILICFSIGLFVSSCKDDFTEEDLLKLQVELGNKQDSVKAAKALAALNQAGELVGLQLKIVNTDGDGIEGLDVAMAAIAGEGGLDEQATTTDANGLAIFDRVPIGGNIVNISGGTIIPVTLNADFGSISDGDHYQIINGNVVPTPVTESAIITVLDEASSTATVSGNVLIETDLTNDVAEVPQGLTVRASFDDSFSSASSFGITYFFATNDDQYNLGSAAVDNTTGAYTMTVPAGVNFDINVPNITVAQRMAINGVNGGTLDMPEYRDVNTSFGSSFGTSAIPTVTGARVVFDAPVAGGSGFVLGNFVRVTRDQGYTFGSAPTTKTDFGTEVFQFTSLGSGYTGSPVVTIDDATAVNTYAEAHVRYAVTGLAVSTTGTGYTDGVSYNFNVIYDEIFDNGDGTTGTNTDVFYSGNVISIEADASGGFIQADVDAALQTAIDNGDFFFDADNLATIADNVSNLRLVNTANGNGDAVLSVSSAEGRVTNFSFTGDDFSNPSFSFSGGGATTQAALSVWWASQWSFDLDNSNTVAYNSLPDVSYEYSDAGTTFSNFESANVDQYDVDGNLINNAIDIANVLTIDGSGNVVAIDPTTTFRTDNFSIDEPIDIVKEPSPGVIAAATPTINTDGQITNLTVSNTGTGYTSEFNATIEPGATDAPGAGATVILVGGSTNTDGTFSWGGTFDITNQGSGYVQDLNVINNNGGTRGYSVGDVTNILLNQGDTYVLDIDYGTGSRAISYN